MATGHAITEPAGSRTANALAASAFLLLFMLVSFLVFNQGFLSSNFLPSGDSASICLGVLEASKFERSLGPYSKFQFHHPGPACFYLLAGGMKLFDWFLPGHGSVTSAQFLVKAAMLAASLAVAFILFEGPIPAVLLAFCYWAVAVSSPILGSTSLCDLLGSLWNPENTAAYLLMTLSAAVLASGRAWGASVFAVPFIIAVHGHLSSLPAAVAMGAWGLAAFFMNRLICKEKLGRPEIAFLTVATLIIILSFIPPAAEALKNQDQGNPVLIAERVFSKQGLPLGFSRAVRFVLGVAVSPFTHVSAALIIGFVVLVAILTVFTLGFIGRRFALARFMTSSREYKNRDFSKIRQNLWRVFFASSVGLAAAVAGASSLRVKPYDYMIMSVLGLSTAIFFCCVYFAAYLAGTTSASSQPEATVGFSESASRSITINGGVHDKWSIVPILILCVGITLFSEKTLILHPDPEALAASRSATEMKQALEASRAVGDRTAPLYIVPADDEGWPAMAALFNDLAWKGWNVMVPHQDNRIGLSFWHPPETLLPGAGPATLMISGQPAPGTVRTRDGVHFRIIPPAGSDSFRPGRVSVEGIQPIFWIDSAEISGENLEIQGWGFIEGMDPRTQKSWILLASNSDAKDDRIPPDTGVNEGPAGFETICRFRPDLARHFNCPAFAEAGFFCRVPLDTFTGRKVKVHLSIENGSARTATAACLLLTKENGNAWRVEKFPQ